MTTSNHPGAAAHDTCAQTAADRLLRLPDVIRIVGLKRSSIYLGVSEGTFPAPVRLTSRAVAWSERAVHAWVSRRIAGHTRVQRIPAKAVQPKRSVGDTDKPSLKRQPASQPDAVLVARDGRGDGPYAALAPGVLHGQ